MKNFETLYTTSSKPSFVGTGEDRRYSVFETTEDTLARLLGEQEFHGGKLQSIADSLERIADHLERMERVEKDRNYILEMGISKSLADIAINSGRG